jgi:hypothetical protein
MNKKKRDYNYPDTDMALGCRITGENLKRNLPDLSTFQVNWNEEFATSFINEVDDVIDTFLGIDPQKKLRQATKTINEIHDSALGDLAALKKVLHVYFKKEAKDIYKQLGYTKYHADARKDQEVIMSLLYAFREGMTEDLRTRIEEKGLSPAVIDRLLDYPNEIYEANVSQETLKSATKEITDEAVNHFNRIYHKAMDICKIASAFYVGNPIKKNQFTFSRIVRNLNAGPTAKDVTNKENIAEEPAMD